MKNKLSLVYIGENHTTRYIEPITESSAIFRNLEDGYNWFYINNTIRREDDIIDTNEVMDVDNAFYTVNSTSNIFGQRAGWPHFYERESGIKFNIMGTPIKASQFSRDASYTAGMYIIYENKTYIF